jgi:hypothetical protein
MGATKLALGTGTEGVGEMSGDVWWSGRDERGRGSKLEPCFVPLLKTG